jgi:hypothetical protein
MSVIWRWNLSKNFAKMIVATLLNKFDCFIVIEGGTGTGKSTMAWDICLSVSREFGRLCRLDEKTVDYYYERIGKKLGLNAEEFVNRILELKQKKAYHFNPYKDLIYSQDAMQIALASWNKCIIPDEMINITFNRDFYSEKQKDIVKEINMFRDHENLILACVPFFHTLDNQIKNLCKIRITIKKRGLAIIHLPNKTIYCKDKWDSATNEKIEREWIMKKILNPNYSKLTTFRGLMKFPQMSKKHEKIYQEIKNKKRANILKNEMGVDIKEEQDAYSIVIDRLLKGGIKNMQFIEGIAIANGENAGSFKNEVRKRLFVMGKNPTISSYFYDKKSKESEEDSSIAFK